GGESSKWVRDEGPDVPAGRNWAANWMSPVPAAAATVAVWGALMVGSVLTRAPSGARGAVSARPAGHAPSARLPGRGGGGGRPALERPAAPPVGSELLHGLNLPEGGGCAARHS